MTAGFAIAAALLLAGLFLLLLETMIPSFGTLGILGGAGILWSVITAYKAGGATGAAIFLALGLFGAPVVVILGLKNLHRTPIGRRFIVTGPASAREQTVETGLAHLEGTEGVARTILRPSGIAQFGTERVNVESEGKFIEPGARIKVLKVVGNKVFVGPV
ncbi:MAG: NfeD family protein [Planctomycetota bacterium]